MTRIEPKVAPRARQYRTLAMIVSAAGACAVGAGLLMVAACRTATAPAIRFAPPGTDLARLQSDFPLSDAERRALTPENLKALTQDQVDQIYARLSPGRMPDGPFRGDLFFPRDRDGRARLDELVPSASASPLTGAIAGLRIEQFGRLLWKGKVFFRSQGIIRNRIEDAALLKLIVNDPATIPKLTFDGQTTWLLFPAQLSCSASRFDAARHSITIDYAKGPTIEGYRPIPDALAGSDGLKIFDEVRIIRRGFYLGRAYFGDRLGLNFTLVDPAALASGSGDGGSDSTAGVGEDCQ